MIKLFKPRLLCIYAMTALLAACASNPTIRPSSNSSFSKPNYSQSNDIWQRVRNGYALPDLYNEEVTNKENYYAQRADYVGRMATRSGDFLYLIMNEVEKRRMPSEIALLPFVESAFVTTAQSPVKAAGLWQFMPATGRDFSLQQNHFVDQRNDVVASTDAALTFLQRLYDQFGDWQLALAAYNWGPGNVNKAVRRAQANGLAGTYSDIKMPLETRQYVPKLQAMKNIVANPALYGITLPNIRNSTRHEIVNVNRDMDINTAARLSGLDEESFKRINPSFKKSVIVASLGSKILVPSERADDVRRALRDSSQNLASVTTYSTYNTESLDEIANKFNTNADNLRYLNNIPPYHSYVKAGSALLVPRTSSRSSQDIPYEALTAGLSTTSGSVGLDNGEFIEQPAIYANNSDETTRQERSGIINPANNGLGLAVSSTNYTRDDDVGALIKNNNNTLNDPLPSNGALVIQSPNLPVTTIATVAPVAVQPIAVAELTTLPVHNSPVATMPPVYNSPAVNAPAAPAVVYEAPQPTTFGTNPPSSINAIDNPITSPPAAPIVAAIDPALTPFVATMTDEPEVIAKPIQAAAPVKVIKPAAPRARVVKPNKIAEVQKPATKTIKTNAPAPAKAQPIATDAKNKKQKISAAPTKPTSKAEPAKKTVTAKPAEKPKSKTIEKPAAQASSPAKKPAAKPTEKVTSKTSSNKDKVAIVRKKTIQK